MGIVSAQFTAWDAVLGNTDDDGNDGNANDGIGFYGESARLYTSIAGLNKGRGVEFKDGDVLMFTLDRGARTLNAVNETSGESALVCHLLPRGGTLYPAACAYGSSGNAIELL